MPTPRSKPSKPYPEFPLFAHARGYWAAKIKGKTYSFGKWEDPMAALQEYMNRIDGIRAGRDPKTTQMAMPAANAGCSIMDACNHFMIAKQHQMDSGELSARMFQQYKDATDLVFNFFGKRTIVESLRPADFTRFRQSFPDSWGLEMLSGVIGRVRSLFKFVSDDGLVAHPVNFGTTFRRPGKIQKRKLRQDKRATVGRLDFTAEELRKLIEDSSGFLKASILLGINGGFGNTDCAKLRASLIDFETGWLDYPRPKTSVERRLCLWPETLQAIRQAMAMRRAAVDDADDGLCFLTSHGKPLVWDRLTDGKYFTVNNLSTAFGKLLTKAKLNRSGHNFYSLRRTFETVAGATKDQVAVDAIMGHVDDSMADRYRQHIEDQRLLEVTNHVHDWLFGQK